MSTALPDLMTVSEAATALRRNPDTIRRYIHKGALKAIKIEGNYMIRRSDLDYLIAGLQVGEAMISERRADGVELLTDAQLDLVKRVVVAALDSIERPRSA